MATRVDRLTDKTRSRGIRVAGVAIILLSIGAALLPVDKGISSDMIGGLLIAGGLIEAVAGSLRRDIRVEAMAAGAVTALAGLLFIINPETRFFPTVTPVIAWLIIRSLILAYASRDSVGIGAPVDRPLGRHGLRACLAAGRRPVRFDPRRQPVRPDSRLVASFAWVLAASFVVNGLFCSKSRAARRKNSSSCATGY